MNIDDIEFVFSKLLNLHSFLDYLVKLNDIDQTRYVLDGHPIPIIYENFRKAQVTRNEIAHHIKNVKVSNTRVISLWDNLLNIIDISTSVFMSATDPGLRSTLESDYDYGIQRETRISTYKLLCDAIMAILIEKGKLLLIRVNHAATLENSILDSIDQSLRSRICRVLIRMSEETLIYGQGDYIYITEKGKKRYRRTTKSEREKWKINVFEYRITADDV